MIQTDNGGEFEKYFAKYIRDKNIIHYYNYPRHPKSNGYIERFNRILQE
jgi:transposase InsO family protein